MQDSRLSRRVSARPDQLRALLLALVAWSALLDVSCSKAISDPPGASLQSASGTPSGNVAFGFDPGVLLAGAGEIRDLSIVGAVIDGARRLVFVAFSTAAPADDAGAGNVPLVRDAPAPGDTNGASDVFLAVVDLSGGASFRTTLLSAFQNQRCINCHGFHSANTTLPNHPGGHPGNNATCGTSGCHDTNGTGGGVVWEAPFDHDFRNRSVEELCTIAQDFPAARMSAEDHLQHDDKILWALQSGRVPNGRIARGGPIGIQIADWQSRVDNWVAGGFQCEAATLLDVVLVSRSRAGARAAAGASFSPSITFVSNPAFDAANPVVPAGVVHVAYVTTSDDIVPSGHTSQVVVRGSIDVWVDRNPSGAPEMGGIDLAPSAARVSRLVSAAAAGAPDGGSDRPAISADGARIAFESFARNLVAGFVDANGADAADVFVNDLDRGVLTLVSRGAGPMTGGDGPSGQPSIDGGGRALAFASGAANLVGDDTNGTQDVFLARLDAANQLASLARASVRGDGSDAGAGVSSHPSVFVRGDDSALVAFESTKKGLVDESLSASSNVFVHDTRGATRLLSRSSSGAAANADSVEAAISPNGRSVAYVSRATNVDTARTDRNGLADVVVVELGPLLATNTYHAERVSISSEGLDADGASSAPLWGAFRGDAGAALPDAFAAYQTQAKNTGASRNTKTVLLLVNNPPRARFTAPATATPGTAITFDASMSNDPDAGDRITRYIWDFGDGSGQVVTVPTVEHSYPRGEDHVVSLVVEDGGGLTDRAERMIRINTPPACLAMFPSEALRDDLVLFDASGSSDADGDALTFTWDFGDGSPTVSGERVMHAYPARRTDPFEVSLTVRDARGAVSTCGGPILIRGLADTPPDCRLTVRRGVGGPVVGENGFVDVGTLLQFDGSASTDADGIASFRWDFGDGVSETGSVVTHMYDQPNFNAAGIWQPHVARLTVTDTLGTSCFVEFRVQSAARFSDFYEDMRSGCGGGSCHGGGPAPELPANSGTGRGNMVNVRSTRCGGALEIVDAGNPNNSTLHLVLGDIDAGNCTRLMPIGGPMKSLELRERLRSWILAGAGNN